MVKLIDNMITGKETPENIEDIYYFKEGKTFH